MNQKEEGHKMGQEGPLSVEELQVPEATLEEEIFTKIKQIAMCWLR